MNAKKEDFYVDSISAPIFDGPPFCIYKYKNEKREILVLPSLLRKQEHLFLGEDVAALSNIRAFLSRQSAERYLNLIFLPEYFGEI